MNMKLLAVALSVAVAIGAGAVRYMAGAQGGDVIVRGEGEPAPAADAEAEAEAGASSQGAPDAMDEQAAPAFVFVDVGGAVNNPGVLAMPAGSRIVDAITAAGGLAEDADVSALNQAVVLRDSDKVYVPTAAEAQQGGALPQSVGTGTAAAGSAANAASSGADGSQGLVNINTAGSEALQQLNGVGPATAQKIIAYRETYGAFSKPEDLMGVSGIGEKTFAKLKDRICV
ncbi:MAG: helix-hairpin-helix domain-containing protein [Clostridiales Family XIII bacterium]|jgi:competence protein ComEA|nr:helix-hairpin-helix domain-containing protein [Clostridiales Family XIII bacterium]